MKKSLVCFFSFMLFAVCAGTNLSAVERSAFVSSDKTRLLLDDIPADEDFSENSEKSVDEGPAELIELKKKYADECAANEKRFAPMRKKMRREILAQLDAWIVEFTKKMRLDEAQALDEAKTEFSKSGKFPKNKKYSEEIKKRIESCTSRLAEAYSRECQVRAITNEKFFRLADAELKRFAEQGDFKNTMAVKNFRDELRRPYKSTASGNSASSENEKALNATRKLSVFGVTFPSSFGTDFPPTALLKGHLYDVKRSKDGMHQYADTSGGTRGARKEQLWRAFSILATKKFKTSELDKYFFKANTILNANQIYVSNRNANAATQAFAGKDGKPPFESPGWIVVYEGDITPPETGEYRFVGMGDDAMLVGINGEPALYAYWPGEGHGKAVEYHKGWEPMDHCGKNGKDGRNGNKFYKGQWIKMEKGRKYKVVIAFGESAGGIAGAQLGIQQKGKYEDDNAVPLFKLRDIDPETLEILKVSGRYKVQGPNFMIRSKK